MLKLAGLFVAVALALSVPAGSAAAAVLGPDAAACSPGSGRAAVLVRVEGFKARAGVLRVQLYGDRPEDFLAKGKKLRRIDLPVSAAGAMEVCVTTPAAGDYAIAVRHDVDGDGKSGWNDGGGFSRNPRLSLASLKPSYRDVFIHVGAAPHRIDVVMNYRKGLSIGPVALAAR